MLPLIFLLLTCGAVRWQGGYLLALAAVGMGLPLCRRENIRLNFMRSAGFWLLAAFGGAYVAFSGLHIGDIKSYWLLPVAAFALGWCAMEQQRDLRPLLLAMGLGFGLHAFGNLLLNWGRSRNALVDLWTGSLHSATGSGFLNTFVFCFVPYGLFWARKRGTQLLLMATAGACALYSLKLGTRTQLAVLAVALVLGSLHFLVTRRSLNKALGLLALVSAAVLAVIACWKWNLFGIADWLRSTNLLQRFEDGSVGDSDQIRWQRLGQGLADLLVHPLGSKETDYYHNMWLDISRVAGVVPMALMAAYSAVTTWRALRLQLEPGCKSLVLCLYAGVLLNFAVEPALQGLFDGFLAFCAVNGMTEQLSSCREDRLWID